MKKDTTTRSKNGINFLLVNEEILIFGVKITKQIKKTCFYCI